jgi:2-polyprenyl-3-methyl-5-hydroxy-6-metoxy-1,4-benzoquinol methylase
MNNCTKLKACVACGSSKLKLILDLNNQPLANSYKDKQFEKQKSFPLAINYCEKCFHVQLTHAVDPDLMFKNYLYVTGTTNTMREHCDWFSKFSVEYFQSVNKSTPKNVFDIGCNDGTQLNYFKEQNLTTAGVDPAANLHEISSQNHEVYQNYFNFKFIEEHPKVYDILVAQNVFAHNSDPAAFLRCAYNLMGYDSLLFIQTSQSDMIKNNEFDTIYHEHISFFNINSMRALCDSVGMFLIDVVKCPLHGSSYIFIVSKCKYKTRPHHISNLIEMEKRDGLFSPETYEKYAKKCQKIKREFAATIDSFRKNKWTVCGYGAAAKGMTFLNFTNVTLDFVVDDNPLKQGKFTPGTSIEIMPSDVLRTINGPLVVVPLAWNFFDEIRGRVNTIRNNSPATFIKYFPKMEII